MEVTANGKTFTFPDGTSTDDIGAAIDEYFAGQSIASQPTEQSQQLSQPQESSQQQEQGGFLSDLGNAAAETGRGLLQAGVNLANIPASMADAVVGAGAWAGNKLGLGDGTYQPAPRVTTEGLAQDLGLQQAR